MKQNSSTATVSIFVISVRILFKGSVCTLSHNAAVGTT